MNIDAWLLRVIELSLRVNDADVNDLSDVFVELWAAWEDILQTTNIYGADDMILRDNTRHFLYFHRRFRFEDVSLLGMRGLTSMLLSERRLNWHYFHFSICDARDDNAIIIDC